MGDLGEVGEEGDLGEVGEEGDLGEAGEEGDLGEGEVGAVEELREVSGIYTVSSETFEGYIFCKSEFRDKSFVDCQSGVWALLHGNLRIKVSRNAKFTRQSSAVRYIQCHVYAYMTLKFVLCVCGAGGHGDDRNPTSRLFVKLSYDTEKETLHDMFPNATDVYLPRDRETGEKRG